MDEGKNYKVRDLALAESGRLKIDWAESRMPVLMALREKYSKTKPLKGLKIAGCLHVTKETAVLVETLAAAGAELAWSGCNPLSTSDEVAAALAKAGTSIYAWHGLSTEEFYWCIEKTIEMKPNLTLDDGADLIVTVHKKHTDLFDSILGGTEETTTGVHRLRSMARQGVLKYPVVAVNDAQTKSDFDNVYGTGQSSLDGILRATSILYAGKTFVVAGYGHCGKGVAKRAMGAGCNVIVTEIDELQALRAVMDGYRVMKMDDAAKEGDVFLTATGCKDVIVKRHYESMKDGAIVCNTGHYDVEVNTEDLKTLSKSSRVMRENNEEYVLKKNGNRIYLLGEGRLVNLAAAEGHPSEVMDMSFANQFMSMIYLAENGKDLENKVYDIAEAQDREIAKVKLQTIGTQIDVLTKEQKAYLEGYEEGT